MTRQMILPLIFGLAGVAVLCGLGTWQVQRLAWKEGVLAEIEARIAADPVAVPVAPDPDVDGYLPVRAEGRFGEGEIHVLVSVKQVGAGYRVIAPFEVDGRRVLVDRGYLPLEEKDAARPPLEAVVTGNLHWPDERDSFTPENDLGAGIWFARDVAALAAALETEPVLIIARGSTGQGITPLPVDTSAIPNDHLGYAITWFSLAAVWAGMTGFFLWRIRRRTE
ncbi:MAG: SURF1 family protein [Rhodobacteraceae bacterium]|nr:SURF1 family protein [Paracoccaceae bacterium]